MITFLIVEDCPKKLIAIKKRLGELDVSELRITDVSNKAAALELLQERPFDFLILDIHIYRTQQCEEISPNAGVDLLVELEDSILSPRNRYNIPNSIFVMSEFPEAILKNGETFKKCKIIPCRYSHDSDDWSQELEVELRRAELKQQSVIGIKSHDIVVYSVHGIQTFGGWQSKLGEALKSYTKSQIVEHIPYKYHHFPITHFLRSGKREYEVANLAKEINLLANRHPEAKICLVGHSFGTYLIAESLKALNTRLNIDKVILCGSVLNSNYDWSPSIQKHNIKNIINECASNDWALVFSHFFAKGLGMAGVESFKPHSGVVTNRYLKGGHSCFFNEITINEWCGYIHGVPIFPKDDRDDAGVSDAIFSFITKTRRRWILIYTFVFLSLFIWFIY